jgi:SMC interacting uncharacterized protein involved in chromosome segregation
MTNDLLTRLRSKYCCDGIDICNCDESANEIERLCAEIARKNAALEALREKDNIAYIIDSHGMTHESFTIVYREKKDD